MTAKHTAPLLMDNQGAEVLDTTGTLDLTYKRSLNMSDDKGHVAAEYQYSRAAYLIVLLQGFGLLLPWNVMLNAISYFQMEYPSNASGISFFLTAAYMYPQVPLLLVMVQFGSRLSFNARILTCLVIQTAAMALMPIVAHTSMWTTLAIAFVLGVTCAVLQSSLFALTSVLPTVYSQGLMSGQGIAGIIATVAEVIVKAAVPSTTHASQQTSALIYFLFSASTLLACIVTYIMLMRMPFTRYHLARSGAGIDGKARAPDAAAVEDAASGAMARGKSFEIPASRRSADDAEIGLLAGEANEAEAPSSTWQVLRGVLTMAVSVFIVFFVTFLAFPSVAPYGLVFKGTLGRISMTDDWWSEILLLVFNVCDTIGRTAPAFVIALAGKWLMGATFLRSVTVVLFVACAKAWAPAFNDVMALIVMVVFSLTNGYFASLCMMSGPQGVQPKDRQKAGLIMSLALQLGILTGSNVSFAFKPPQT